MEFNITNVTHVATNVTHVATCARQIGPVAQLVFTVMYITGVLGNMAALSILYRSEKQMRNKKIILMLRCLASNDLVALVGMLILMYLQMYLPEEHACSHEFCVARVIWRHFGLSSGCVAMVMAIERWLALTHPFLYQKHITYNVIRRTIFCLWIGVFVLVCLPFFGFGLYFEKGTCMRYKEAKRRVDVAYAYLFFFFGTLLCVCIVLCNLAVIRVLCHLGCRNTRRRVLMRRISRNSSATRSVSSGSSTAGVLANGGEVPLCNMSTPEEVAFARLMAVLSLMAVLCWMPQMITILLAQWAPESKFTLVLYKVADGLMMLHFVLDPLFYVLLRCQRRPCFPNILKLLCHTCWSQPGGHGSHPTSLAMTDHEHCPSLDVTGEPSCERATAAAV